MRNPDVSASDVQAARSKLSTTLYGSLAKATEERDRREGALQSLDGGTAAYAAAWSRYMAATTARENAVKALETNFFHVDQ